MWEETTGHRWIPLTTGHEVVLIWRRHRTYRDMSIIKIRRQMYCLFNSFFRPTTKQTSKLHITDLFWMESTSGMSTSQRHHRLFSDGTGRRSPKTGEEKPNDEREMQTVHSSFLREFSGAVVFRRKRIPYLLYKHNLSGGECPDVRISRCWWRHQMETFSALLAICAGNSPVTGEFPSQRPVTRSFDVFFDLSLNKRLSKQSWGWYLGRHHAHYDVFIM